MFSSQSQLFQALGHPEKVFLERFVSERAFFERFAVPRELFAIIQTLRAFRLAVLVDASEEVKSQKGRGRKFENMGHGDLQE